MTPVTPLTEALRWAACILWLAFLAAVALVLAYLAVTFVWALVQLTLPSVWGVTLPGR